MANNILRIKIIDNPNVDSFIRITFGGDTHTFRFVDNRSGSDEVTIGDDVKETRDNFISALELDINSGGDYKIIKYGDDKVYINSLTLTDFTDVFSGYIISHTNSYLSPGDLFISEFIEFEINDGYNDIQESLVRSSDLIYSNEFIDQNIRKIIINVETNPVDGDMLEFDLSTNGTSIMHYMITFSDSISDFTHVVIGVDEEETTYNIYRHLDRYYRVNMVDYKFNLDEVYIYTYSNVTEPIGEYTIIQNDATLYFAYDINIITTQTTHSTYKIYYYCGDKLFNTPVEPDYIITKNLISDELDHTYLDYTNLVRDKFKTDITRYYLDRGDIDDISSGSNISKSQECLGMWCKIITHNNVNDIKLSSRVSTYYITNGFVNNYEENRLKPFLTTNKNKTYHKESMSRIYFRTKNLVEFTLTDDVTTSDLTSYVYNDVTESDEYINSIRVNDHRGDIQLKLSYDYNGDIIDNYLNIKFVDSCKYDVIDLIFINKYGVFETISMFKKSIKKDNITRNEYSKSNLSLGGVYNYHNHSLSNYNVIADEEWTLNSDYIHVDMVDQFNELMLSEKVWISYIDKSDRFENQTNEDDMRKLIILPVVIKDKTFNKKTNVNDGLIQFSVNVKLSNNKIKRFI